ncbi:hypothetical protein QR680_004289 [Steinernema hermaphroditum]|uniref:Acyl-coenzyme A oxidase n=1 Tax=Steinernema hermaphroditum TaxID=289476 RepID=A0AA39LTF1_9BILA|nr:hypothetical protein QR680_004289 [Steinernema hermaphroditum]
MTSDFPNGPLSEYREKATFDWRKLKIFLDGEENIEFTSHVLKTLRDDPLFHREWKTESLEKTRENTRKRWQRLVEYDLLGTRRGAPFDEERSAVFQRFMEQYDVGLAGRHGLSTTFVPSVIMAMGTEKHKPLLEALRKNEIVGCVSITELSHGSNTKRIGTTATFDNGEFVLHTPDIEATKCWAGNLGQSNTHAVVFAQLHIKGICYGVHAFVVEVRDRLSMHPLLGVTIGDMGEKPGAWNGVENGWMVFNKFRVPLSSLLDKGAQVSPDGVYRTTYKNRQEQQASSLGALSTCRVGLVATGARAATMGAVIAIRYSLVRRQLSLNGKEGVDYLQKHRLFPIIAGGLVVSMFHKCFHIHFKKYMERLTSGEKSPSLAALSKEVHALSCATKPVSTWMGARGLAEAQAACGGLGFLKSSRLSELQGDFDAAQTYEGENYMIIQQAANYLLSLHGKNAKTPMGSADFLAEKMQGFGGFSSNIINDVIAAYRWLILYHLDGAKTEIRKHLSMGTTHFDAKNKVQVNHCQPMAIAYAELTMFRWAFEHCLEAREDLRGVLLRICKIYALANIEKHLSTLYIGGYCNGPEFGKRIQEEMAEAEDDLTIDAASLCDAMAPPDFFLNSSLGASDGNVYERLCRGLQRTVND